VTAFDRVWRVTVGTLRVSKPMRVAFEIERGASQHPNSARVSVWNLTRDQQGQIERASAAQVVIEAGHAQERGLECLFSGELVRGGRRDEGAPGTDRDRVDAVTHVEARDAGITYAQARISQSFGAGASVQQVVRACATAMRIGTGNLDELAALAEHEVGGSTYPEGTTLTGQASRELTRILDGLGLRWSVQHGALHLRRRGEALRQQAVRLATGSGLIGRVQPQTGGRVKARSILNSNLAPNRTVIIESDELTGRFVVRSVKHGGDSHVNDWYSDVELATEGRAA
jgi:hypothetical protein